MKKGLILALLVTLASAGRHAVLVAGSNGFENYRHQADICHAYHTLLDHGFLPDHIILMSYNDVANSSQNPYPGTLYNKPGDNARDYNNGCVKDYTGGSVTPQNFLAIIQGQRNKVKGGNGRVLESTKNDHVFIYFADHGATGLIAFPRGELYANEFNQALKNMHFKKMYNQMAIYIEACESGSMFHNKLPPHISIYGVTASNPRQSSWAAYCPPNDKVDGKSIGSCLGDLFSVSWMEDTDAANVLQETLEDQYKTVKQETKRSQVMQYGDLSFIHENIGLFEGNTNPSFRVSVKDDVVRDAHWESRDVKLQYLQNLYQNSPSKETARQLIREIYQREHVREVFKVFSELSSQTENLLEAEYEPQDFDCLKKSMGYYKQYCGKMSDFDLKFVKVLVNACEARLSEDEIHYNLVQACSINHQKKQEPVLDNFVKKFDDVVAGVKDASRRITYPQHQLVNSQY